MEETAERENIYNVPPSTATYILPNCHTESSERRDRAKLSFSQLEGAARRQPPKQRSFHGETQHLPATNAPITIKHKNAKSAKSRLTISIQSSAQLLSSHYLLSSLPKAIFVGEHPLISIRGHTQSTDTSRPWFYEEL